MRENVGELKYLRERERGVIEAHRLGSWLLVVGAKNGERSAVLSIIVYSIYLFDRERAERKRRSETSNHRSTHGLSGSLLGFARSWGSNFW